ncbi:MAG: hypothetical protein M3Q98_15175 [Actinomycetota bacterium]|nr:hypothetical protein [Actinomycetota bacterium]
MDTPVGGDRTTRQLRNDVDDIYDLLGTIGRTVNAHTTRLDEHTVKLDHIIDLLHTR